MEEVKIGFFKRVLISIKDFEKYDIFALEDWKNSVKYLFTLLLIFSLIATIVFSIKILTGGLEELVIEVQSEINEELKMDIEEMKSIIQQNYSVFFIVIFFSVLAAYFTTSFIDAAMLGVLGLIIARFVGMRIKYKATFNIGAYALTLPLILQIIYLSVYLLTGFEVKYFQWMYATISYIYVVVSILMMKTQFINQQRELMKIQLEQEKIREEMKEQEKQQDEENKTKEEKDEKEDKKENEKDNNLGAEPEGTNA